MVYKRAEDSGQLIMICYSGGKGVDGKTASKFCVVRFCRNNYLAEIFVLLSKLFNFYSATVSGY